jgi:hypothetical protein
MAQNKEFKMLFELGQVVATQGAVSAIEENNIDMLSLLSRHTNGDWGCIPDEDKQENQRSLENGYRLLSSYPLNEQGEKLWIITEADRSVTTLLLPDEY